MTPLKPSSKSSTSNSRDTVREHYIRQQVDAGEFKALLLDLLAIIHRDGGQYTLLAGLPESIIDAEAKVVWTREALTSAMQPRAKVRKDG